MSKQKYDNHKLISLTGIKQDNRLEAINMMSELEEVQNINDDIIGLITKQNDAIEAVIQKLIKAGVYYG